MNYRNNKGHHSGLAEISLETTAFDIYGRIESRKKGTQKELTEKNID